MVNGKSGPGKGSKTLLNHKFDELSRVKELVSDGFSNKEIAEELSVTVNTVETDKKYLKKLEKADLTNAEIGEKRAELFLELSEISKYAKDMYFHLTKDMNEEDGKVVNVGGIRLYLVLWKDIVESKMKLYGLDSVKMTNLLQINNQFSPGQTTAPDVIDITAGEKIAQIIKENHERKIR